MSFEETFEHFLDSINNICKKKTKRYEKTEELNNLLSEVIRELKAAKGEISNKILKGIEDNEKKGLLIGFLEKEMEYFTNSVTAEPDRNQNPTGEMLDCRIGQAKTIKDSISIWLPPWSWLKKLLDILNELLDLIKALP